MTRDVVREGTTYLRIVAPAYGALGFGFVVSFATQGAGRAMWPLAASLARILIAAGGSWLAVTAFGAGMAGLAAMVTASLACLCRGLQPSCMLVGARKSGVRSGAALAYV